MPEEKTEKNLISLSRASEITGYNQDYLGFLARSGKLEAQKIGRNWVTSVAAINSLLGNAPELVQQVVKPDGFVQSDLFAIKQAAQKVFDDQRDESIKLSVASKLQKFEEDFKLEMSAAVAAATVEKVFGIVPTVVPPAEAATPAAPQRDVAFKNASGAVEVMPAAAPVAAAPLAALPVAAQLSTEKIYQSFQKNLPVKNYAAVAAAACVAVVALAAFVGYRIMTNGIADKFAPLPTRVVTNTSAVAATPAPQQPQKIVYIQGSQTVKYVQGPAGAAGARGAQGPQGPAGANGTTTVIAQNSPTSQVGTYNPANGLIASPYAPIASDANVPISLNSGPQIVFSSGQGSFNSVTTSNLSAGSASLQSANVSTLSTGSASVSGAATFSGPVTFTGSTNFGSTGLQLISPTAPQLTAGYDTSDTWSSSTASTGATTFTFTGSAPSATFKPSADSTSAVTFANAAGAPVLQVDTQDSALTGGTAATIGLAAQPFSNAYFGNVTLGSTLAPDANAAIVFQRGAGNTNAQLQWNAGAGDLRYFSVNYPVNATYTVDSSSISTTANLYSGMLTNNATTGTQNLLSLTNAGTGTTANGIYVNNTGTGTTALQIAGTWTNGIVTNNNSINTGTGALTAGAANLAGITASGNVTLSATSPVIDSPNGTLSINTVTNKPVTFGTGLLTANGQVNINENAAAGNGQTTHGVNLNVTDATTGGGAYTGLAITATGSGAGTGSKYLLDLVPTNTSNEIVFDSSGSLHPTAPLVSTTASIGSPSNYFKNAYFDTITANNIAGTVVSGATSSTSWTLGSTQAGDTNEALIFQRNSGSNNATLQWNSGSGDQRYLGVNYPFNATYTVSNSSISASADLFSGTLTNNTTSGTQNLLSLTNTGTGTTANGIYLNNTGTGTTALQIAGTWTNGIVTNGNSINAGSGSISAANLTVSGLTANAFVYSGTGGAVTATTAPTNGQILIGSTGSAPVATALNTGNNILITNGAGSITVATVNNPVFSTSVTTPLLTSVATLTIDSASGSPVNIGQTNASAVNIGRVGVATNIGGSLAVTGNITGGMYNTATISGGTLTSSAVNGVTTANILTTGTTFGGDVSGTYSALALNAVNSNVGTYGSSSAVPIVTVNAKGLVTAVSTASISSSWSALTNPTTNLSLSMGANTTAFTWGAATGSSVNPFTIADTANNTGTGNLVQVATASGSALNPFAVLAKGSSAIQVLANGNVGIGTTTPNQLLTVYGNLSVATSSTPYLYVNTANANPQVSIGTAAPNTSDALTISSANTGGTTIAMANTSAGGGTWRIYSSGNGNGQGAGKLIIAGSGDTGQLLFNQNGDLGVDNSSPAYNLDVLATPGASNPFNVASSSGASELTVINNGNVGIGTTSPGSTLTVAGPAGTSGATGTAATQVLAITGGAGGNSTGASTAGAAGAAINLTAGAGGNSTGVAGTNGANITLQGGAGGTGTSTGSYGNILLNPSGGNVGIGSTTLTSLFNVGSAAQFQVNSSGALTAAAATVPTLIGSTSANGTLTLQGNSATSGNTLTSAAINLNVGNSGATTAMTILNNGNVGINNTAPAQALDIQGNEEVRTALSNNPAPVFVQEVNGGHLGSGGTISIAPTTGNLLVLWVAGDCGVNTVTSITDTKGNTFTRAIAVGGDEMWYAKNVTGGADTITVNTTGANNFFAYVSEYSGADTVSPLDQTSSGTGGTSGSKSLSYANELIVGGGYATNGIIAGSGFTLLGSGAWCGGSADNAVEYGQSGATGSYAATFQDNGVDGGTVSGIDAVMATFKPVQTVTYSPTLYVGGGTVGAVGVDTTAPSYLLDVNPSSGVTEDLFRASLGTGGTGLVVKNGGNVGIETTTPNAALDVKGSIVQTSTVFATETLATATQTGACSGVGTSITGTQAVFKDNVLVPLSSQIFYNTTATKLFHATISSVATCTDGSSNKWYVLTLGNSIASQASGDTITLYTPAGDTGNSTSGFTNNLYAISGHFVTTTSSGGFDVAEQYQTTDATMAAGNVVSVDPTNAQYVVKSGGSYDASVVGVISTTPGMTLGANLGSAWQKVALTGRVPVVVTDENGVPKPGDFLTSSATMPGFAMLATHSGKVIGEVLDSWVVGTQQTQIVNGLTFHTNTVDVDLHVGWENVNNTFVMGAQDPVAAAESAQQSTGATTASLAASSDSDTFIIRQNSAAGAPLADILQLQSGSVTRLMVASSGAVSINEAVGDTAASLFAISNNGTSAFTVSASGNVAVSGTLVVKQDIAALGEVLGSTAVLAQNADTGALHQGELVMLKGATAVPVVGSNPTITVVPAVTSSSLGVAAPQPVVIGIVDRNLANFDIPGAPAASGSDVTVVAPGEYADVVTAGTYATLDADASAGAISIGDRLTLSSNPGYAADYELSTDAGMPVVGIALDALASGTGHVRVLLELGGSVANSSGAAAAGSGTQNLDPSVYGQGFGWGPSGSGAGLPAAPTPTAVPTSAPTSTPTPQPTVVPAPTTVAPTDAPVATPTPAPTDSASDSTQGN